ncbi:MAG TPA: very short patch repair endonuclease [Thermoplasmata archaeon]|nr:very short patch repair endonuclease [Thermoplasmata archaeon]
MPFHPARTRRTSGGPPTRSYLRDGRAPLPARETTSRVMSANRGKDTTPELALRRELGRLGIRGYRLHQSSLAGRPDLSFGRKRVAVFVHGCFWHRCPRCDLPLPKTHTAWWQAKFARNRARDEAKERHLAKDGWRVLILWECQIREDVTRSSRSVEQSLRDATLTPAHSVSKGGPLRGH